MSIEQFLQRSLSKTKMGCNILCILFSASLLDTLNAQEVVEDKKKEKIEAKNIRIGLYNNDNYVKPFEVGGIDAGKSFNFDTTIKLIKGENEYKINGEIAGYTMYGREKITGEIMSYLEYLLSLKENEIAVYDEDEWNNLQEQEINRYTYGSDIGDAQRIDQFDVSLEKLIGSIDNKKSSLSGYIGGGITSHGNYGMEKIQSGWHKIGKHPNPEIRYEKQSGWTPYIIGSVKGKYLIVGEERNGVSFEGSLGSKIPLYPSKGTSEANIDLAIQWVKNRRKTKIGHRRGYRKGPENTLVISQGIIDGATNSYYYQIEAALPFSKKSASIYYNIEKYIDGGYSARKDGGEKFDNNHQMNIGIIIDLDSKK